MTFNTAYALKLARDRQWLGGEFVWAGEDYIGEASGSFPATTRSTASSTSRASRRTTTTCSRASGRPTPMVHIVPMNWTDYKPGQNVTVYAYSNQKNVDLKVVDPTTGRDQRLRHEVL